MKRLNVEFEVYTKGNILWRNHQKLTAVNNVKFDLNVPECCVFKSRCPKVKKICLDKKPLLKI